MTEAVIVDSWRQADSRRTVDELWTAVENYQRKSQELALNLVTMALTNSHLPTLVQLGIDEFPENHHKRKARRRNYKKTEIQEEETNIQKSSSTGSEECVDGEEYQIPFTCTDRNSPPTSPPPAFSTASPRVALNSEYILLDEYCCEVTKEENVAKVSKKTGKISKFEQMSNMRCGVENGRPLLTYRDGSTGSDLKRFEKELAYEKRRFESHWKRVIKKGERKITLLEAEQMRKEEEVRARSQSKHSESSDVSTNTDPNTDEGVPNVCEVSLTDTFSGSVNSSFWSDDTDFDDFDVCRICTGECISVEFAMLGICKICFQITFPNISFRT